MSASFDELADLLVGSAKRERKRLQRTIEWMLKVVQVIPLDAHVLDHAGKIEAALEMPALDSIVLASVMSHLAQTKPVESCFLNRNTRDFDDSRVREMLDQHGCKFFGRFDEGLHYIEARLAHTGSD